MNVSLRPYGTRILLKLTFLPTLSPYGADYQRVIARTHVFYEIERRKNEGDFNTVAKTKPNGTRMYRYDDYEVQPATDYFYRLKMTDNDGSFRYSPVVHAKLPELEASLTISPNVTAGQVTILTKQPFILPSLRILDAGGQVFFSKSGMLLPCPLDLTFLQNGMYFMEAETGNGRVFERFIINK
jgi:hypothetical protein